MNDTAPSHDSRILLSILKLPFHALFFFTAIVLVALSLLRQLPSKENAWEFALRTPIHRPLLLSGVLCAIVAVIIYVLVYSPHITRSLGYTQRIRIAYRSCSWTQQDIIRTLIKYPRTEVPLDNLHELISRASGPSPDMTPDELYYRVIRLEDKKLLGLKSVGERATVVIMAESVMAALKAEIT
jgi:hypothetical protein